MSNLTSTQFLTPTKDQGLQILRVVFTIWILLYHSFNEYILKGAFNIQPHEELEFMRGITNLVLQGFMFISGLLLARGYFNKGKYHDRGKFIKDKFKRLLIPYLFWSLALVVFYNVSGYEVICGAKHLWFLLCLFDLMVMSIIILPALNKTSKIVDIIICTFVLILPAVINQLNFRFVLGLKTSIIYLPSFMVGLFIVKYHLDELFVKMHKLTFYIITSLIFAGATVSIMANSLPYGSLYLHIPYYLAPPRFICADYQMLN